MSSIQSTPDGGVIGLQPKQVQAILMSLSHEVEKLTSKNYRVVVLTSPKVRYYFRQLTAQAAPGLVVLSHNEITQNIEIQSMGMVSIR